MVILALITGAAAQGKMKDAAQDHDVTVCIVGVDARVAPGALLIARDRASQSFAAIGVNIAWRHGDRGCGPDAILLCIAQNTPVAFRPAALAYAEPRRRFIRVFYDRIDHIRQTRTPVILGYVFTHEITHVLQGIVRHSDGGIMKAHWDESDFTNMLWKTFNFEPEDIRLLHQGLRLRMAYADAPESIASSGN
jgi:hypothetical protein